MTLEKKLEIVSKNYADKYVEDVDVKSMVHKAYCEGFKAGYKKATAKCEDQMEYPSSVSEFKIEFAEMMDKALDVLTPKKFEELKASISRMLNDLGE